MTFVGFLRCDLTEWVVFAVPTECFQGILGRIWSGNGAFSASPSSTTLFQADDDPQSAKLPFSLLQITEHVFLARTGKTAKFYKNAYFTMKCLFYKKLARKWNLARSLARDWTINAFTCKIAARKKLWVMERVQIMLRNFWRPAVCCRLLFTQI